VEAHAAITQHRKQVKEDTAKPEPSKSQHLDILGSGRCRRQLRRRSWSDWARSREPIHVRSQGLAEVRKADRRHHPPRYLELGATKTRRFCAGRYAGATSLRST
jgi:hypothetical protein